MEKMNPLELDLLQAIVDENQEKHPYLQAHVAQLNVAKREFDGVKACVYFEYDTDALAKEDSNCLLSASKELHVEGFKELVTYVLDITDGKIETLEILPKGKDKIQANKALNYQLI